MIDRIDRVLKNLQTMPLMGVELFNVGKNIRSISFENYAIYYRYEGDVIFILRVLSRYRDRQDVMFDE